MTTEFGRIFNQKNRSAPKAIGLKTLIALTLILQSGCGDEGLKSYTSIEDLRVLAIHTATPEVSPGASVTLTPVIADINGSGTPTEAVAACEDPGVSIGAEPTCVGANSITTSAGAALSLDASTRIGTGTQISLTVPSDYLSGSSAITQWNGRIVLVTYTVQSSTGARVRSFARIRVSQATKTSKNSNPGLTAILGNGSSLAAVPTIAIDVSAQTGAAETYSIFSLSGGLTSATETIQTTWFKIRGSFESFRTEGSSVNRYTPPENTSATNAWVVVTRDGRGGESIRTLGLAADLNLQ